MHFISVKSTLWMVCEYIQSTHGIALAINVVRLWRRVPRWRLRCARELGVPSVVLLVGSEDEAPIYLAISAAVLDSVFSPDVVLL